MSVKGQLAKLMKARNVTVPDIARNTGIARSTLYSMLSRESAAARPRSLKALAAYLEVPTEFFLEDWDPPADGARLADQVCPGGATVGRGEGGAVLENVTRKIIWKLSGEFMAVQMNDESMATALSQGAVVLVNREQKPTLGQTGLFEYEGAAVIRRLGRDFLLPANALFRPLPLDGDWKSLGTVVGSMRW